MELMPTWCASFELLHMSDMWLLVHVPGVLPAAPEGARREGRHHLVHVLALHVLLGQHLPLQLARYDTRLAAATSMRNMPPWVQRGGSDGLGGHSGRLHQQHRHHPYGLH